PLRDHLDVVVLGVGEDAVRIPASRGQGASDANFDAFVFGDGDDRFRVVGRGGDVADRDHLHIGGAIGGDAVGAFAAGGDVAGVEDAGDVAGGGGEESA